MAQINEQYAADYRSKVTLDEIPIAGQNLLMKSAQIEPDQVLDYVLKLRDEAFRIAPYPAFGQVRFLRDPWPTWPYFEDVLRNLQAGQNLLDVGCGLGQQIRFLIHTYEVDPKFLHGFDIHAGLVNLGYKYFRDREKLPDQFFAADILNLDKSPRLRDLQGSFDQVHLSQVVHIYEWDNMLKAMKNAVRLLRPRSGSLIVGNQQGSFNAGTYSMLESVCPSGKMYRHNATSWQRFWDQIGEETDSEWHVEYEPMYSEAVEKSRQAWWADPGMNVFWFRATRR